MEFLICRGPKEMKVMKKLGRSLLAPGTLLALLALSACSGMPTTTFVHPDYNFGFIERVGVVPFENLTDDRGAGARMSRYFLTELLATEAFDVVEPGEMSRALLPIGSMRVAEITREQIRQIGTDVGAQAVFLGSVMESEIVRSGSNTESVVSFNVRLVETETGSVVWSTSLGGSGRGFFSSLFGTSGKSMGEVTRDVARRAIDSLVE